MTNPPPPLSDRIPAPALFVSSALLQYIGAAIAIGQVFATVGPAGTAWWRVSISALVLMVLRRPWRRLRLTLRDLVEITLLGLAITLMNMTFYEGAARIPLGATVSIEFIGPVIVALIRSQGLKVKIAALLAFSGVLSISGLGVDIFDYEQRVGIFFSLLAGAAWAAYILIGSKRASGGSGIDSLTLGLFMASLLLAAIPGRQITLGWSSGHLFCCIIALALLSTAIPFPIEQIALRRLGPDIYALMTSLMPAVSELVSMVLLQQIPNLGEVFGLVSISLAVAIVSYNPRRKNSDRLAPPA